MIYNLLQLYTYYIDERLFNSVLKIVNQINLLQYITVVDI